MSARRHEALGRCYANPGISTIDNAPSLVAVVLHRRSQVCGLRRRHKSFIKSSLSAVKGARDEQSNNRQRRTEDKLRPRRHRPPYQALAPPTSLIFPVRFNRQLVEQKAWKPRVTCKVPVGDIGHRDDVERFGWRCWQIASGRYSRFLGCLGWWSTSRTVTAVWARM